MQSSRFYLALSLILTASIIYGVSAVSWPTVAPTGEKDGGWFTNLFKTKELSVSWNAIIEGNIMVWYTGGSAKICLNGNCNFMDGIDVSGNKTCWMSEADAAGKWCPNGSYVSAIKKVCGDGWTCNTQSGSLCRFFNNSSPQAQAITHDGDMCTWTPGVTYLAVKFNTTGPYISYFSWNVQVNTGWTFTNAANYMMLQSGSIVTTGPWSRVALIFTDDSIIRLNENTRIILVYDDTNTDVQLEEGELWARVLRPFTENAIFTVESSDLAVWVRGTSLYMKKTIWAWANTELKILDSWDTQTGSIVSYKNTTWTFTVSGIIYPEQQVMNNATYPGGMVYASNSPNANVYSMNDFIRESTQEDIVYMSTLLEKKTINTSYEKRMFLKLQKEINNTVPQLDTSYYWSETGSFYTDSTIISAYAGVSRYMNTDLLIDLSIRESALRNTTSPTVRTNIMNTTLSQTAQWILSTNVGRIMWYCLPGNFTIWGNLCDIIHTGVTVKQEEVCTNGWTIKWTGTCQADGTWKF